MKKLLCVFLAVVMMFTMTTVAFAVDPAPADSTTTADEETTVPQEHIPFWQVKVGLKVGKIIIKITKALVKVGMALGLLKSDELLQKVMEMFGQLQTPSEPTTQAPTTVAAPAA